MSRFFTVEEVDGRARAGMMSFGGIEVTTPYFQPIATRGIVKDATFADLKRMGFPHVLMNTYHLLCRPGLEAIQQLGGLKKFTGWDGGILTDSGGFQIFSLSPLRKVTLDGVHFRDYESGKPFFLTPEAAVDAQVSFRADIAMALDVCSPLPSEPKQLRKDLAVTHDWARRAHAHWKERGGGRTGTRLFGIVQGGTDLALREESIAEIAALDFPGIAVGGLSVGETRAEFLRTAAFCAEHLPVKKPRYLMGVGTPDDLVEAIAIGYDLFDCVLPTRMARRGVAYTWEGVMNLKLRKYALDIAPVSPTCKCQTCRTHSRAFLRHLIAADEVSAAILLTYHNLHFYRELMGKARRAVLQGSFQRFRGRRCCELDRKL
jgi:queuine tRNA-ribosyltransferase